MSKYKNTKDIHLDLDAHVHDVLKKINKTYGMYLLHLEVIQKENGVFDIVVEDHSGGDWNVKLLVRGFVDFQQYNFVVGWSWDKPDGMVYHQEEKRMGELYKAIKFCDKKVKELRELIRIKG